MSAAASIAPSGATAPAASFLAALRRCGFVVGASTASMEMVRPPVPIVVFADFRVRLGVETSACATDFSSTFFSVAFFEPAIQLSH